MRPSSSPSAAALVVAARGAVAAVFGEGVPFICDGSFARVGRSYAVAVAALAAGAAAQQIGITTTRDFQLADASPSRREIRHLLHRPLLRRRRRRPGCGRLGGASGAARRRDQGWGIASDGSGGSLVTGAFYGTATFGATSLTSSGGATSL